MKGMDRYCPGKEYNCSAHHHTPLKAMQWPDSKRDSSLIVLDRGRTIIQQKYGRNQMPSLRKEFFNLREAGLERAHHSKEKP
jgi:hypothetical protein